MRALLSLSSPVPGAVNLHLLVGPHVGNDRSGRGLGFQGGFSGSGGPPPGGAFGGGMKRDFDGGDERDQKRMRY